MLCSIAGTLTLQSPFPVASWRSRCLREKISFFITPVTSGPGPLGLNSDGSHTYRPDGCVASHLTSANLTLASFPGSASPPQPPRTLYGLCAQTPFRMDLETFPVGAGTRARILAVFAASLSLPLSSRQSGRETSWTVPTARSTRTGKIPR